MKLDKVLCCMFLFSFLALNGHKSHALMYEHKTKDCAQSSINYGLNEL